MPKPHTIVDHNERRPLIKKQDQRLAQLRAELKNALRSLLNFEGVNFAELDLDQDLSPMHRDPSDKEFLVRLKKALAYFNAYADEIKPQEWSALFRSLPYTMPDEYWLMIFRKYPRVIDSFPDTTEWQRDLVKHYGDVFPKTKKYIIERNRFVPAIEIKFIVDHEIKASKGWFYSTKKRNFISKFYDQLMRNSSECANVCWYILRNKELFSLLQKEHERRIKKIKRSKAQPETTKEVIKRALEEKVISLIINLDLVKYDDSANANQGGDIEMDFDMALAESPQWVLPLLGHAAACRLQGKDAEALIDLNVLLNKEPNHMLALHMSSAIYLSQGNYTQALKNLDVILRIEPKDILALFRRVVIYRAQGRDESAANDLKVILDVKPNNKLALNMSVALCHFYARKEYLRRLSVINAERLRIRELKAEIVKRLIAGKRNKPNCSMVSNPPYSLDDKNEDIACAQLYRQQKQFEKALNSINRVLAADPSCVLARTERAYVYWQQGELKEAQLDVRLALIKDPSNTRAKALQRVLQDAQSKLSDTSGTFYYKSSEDQLSQKLADDTFGKRLSR